MGFIDDVIGGLPILGDIYDAYKDKRAEDLQKHTINQNYSFQKEFATEGIRWKVNDAKKAGIHPLYALGANTIGFSPLNIGGSRATNFGTMGQNINSYYRRYMTPEGKRTQRVEILSAEEELRNRRLSNDILEIEKRDLEQSKSITSDKFGVIDGQSDAQVDDMLLPSHEPTLKKNVKITRGLSGSVGLTQGHEYIKRQLPYSDQRGIASGVEPGSRYILLADGRTAMEMPREQLAEGTDSSLYHKAKFFLFNIKKHARYLMAHQNLRWKGREEVFKEIRAQRPKWLPQRNGLWEWRYAPWGGYYVLHRKEYKGDTQLFYGTKRSAIPN